MVKNQTQSCNQREPEYDLNEPIVIRYYGVINIVAYVLRVTSQVTKNEATKTEKSEGGCAVLCFSD